MLFFFSSCTAKTRKSRVKSETSDSPRILFIQEMLDYNLNAQYSHKHLARYLSCNLIQQELNLFCPVPFKHDPNSWPEDLVKEASRFGLQSDKLLGYDKDFERLQTFTTGGAVAKKWIQREFIEHFNHVLYKMAPMTHILVTYPNTFRALVGLKYYLKRNKVCVICVCFEKPLEQDLDMFEIVLELSDIIVSTSEDIHEQLDQLLDEHQQHMYSTMNRLLEILPAVGYWPLHHFQPLQPGTNSSGFLSLPEGARRIQVSIFPEHFSSQGTAEFYMPVYRDV